MHALQMELKECRLRLAEERRARLKAESRLMEVMVISKSTNMILSVIYFYSVSLYCKKKNVCAAVISLPFLAACGHCYSLSFRDLVSSKLCYDTFTLYKLRIGQPN